MVVAVSRELIADSSEGLDKLCCEPCASAPLSLWQSTMATRVRGPSCLCMQAVEAMRLGNEAAKFVSAAFPNPMELKFERVAQPFLLLHVNRCLHMLVPHCLGPK